MFFENALVEGVLVDVIPLRLMAPEVLWNDFDDDNDGDNDDDEEDSPPVLLLLPATLL